MPNAKVLESKKAVVAALVEQLKNAQSGVLVDYSGITVAEDTELRAKLREGEVKYGVVKNNMVRRALDASGLLAPIVSLAAVLAAIVESKGGAPAEEAPAAE